MPLWTLILTITSLFVAGIALGAALRSRTMQRIPVPADHFADSPHPMWVYNPQTLRFLDECDGAGNVRLYPRAVS